MLCASESFLLIAPGRFTPGTSTNQIPVAFLELQLPTVTDPRADHHQRLAEASYVNRPIIALCSTASPLPQVGMAIPCNNEGAHSVGRRCARGPGNRDPASTRPGSHASSPLPQRPWRRWKGAPAVEPRVADWSGGTQGTCAWSAGLFGSLVCS